MKHILIVEDDKLLQKLYTDEFSDMELTILETADKTYEYLSSHTPDLILLDVMLPGGKNGFDILEFLKRSDTLKQIPVIMMTNLESEKETAISIGATDYCIKADLELSELRQKINALLQ